MEIFQLKDVFVPGGLPVHTYNPRKDFGLEDKFLDAMDSNKICSVTGATKSGKSVLVKTVLQGKLHAWLDGGTIRSIEEFWTALGNEIGAFGEMTTGTSTETGGEFSGEVTGEASAFFVKGGGKTGGKVAHNRSYSTESKAILSLPVQVLKTLKNEKIPLVVDDFHYIQRPVQAEITRALKSAVFEGVPIVYISIPQRRFDAIKVEPEMEARMTQVAVPPWSIEELLSISERGFPKLRVAPNLIISRFFAANAEGSPHLMQEFCKQLCKDLGIRQTGKNVFILDPNRNYDFILRSIAADQGKIIFDKLAEGPREALSQMLITLNSGDQVSIYRAVLIVLSQLGVGRTTVSIDSIQGMFPAISRDEPPESSSIAWAVSQMASIKSKDDSSVAIIDYEREEKKVHITDPFFAFFLKWGRNHLERY